MTGAVNVLMGGISITASAAPSPVSGSGTGTVTTATATTTVIGGEPTLSYLWSQASGDAMTITNPNGATTAFQRAGVIVSDSFTGFFRCLVTDAAGRTALTNTIQASITGV